jgi:hypothetical protein
MLPSVTPFSWVRDHFLTNSKGLAETQTCISTQTSQLLVQREHRCLLEARQNVAVQIHRYSDVAVTETFTNYLGMDSRGQH